MKLVIGFLALALLTGCSNRLVSVYATDTDSVHCTLWDDDHDTPSEQWEERGYVCHVNAGDRVRPTIILQHGTGNQSAGSNTGVMTQVNP